MKWLIDCLHECINLPKELVSLIVSYHQPIVTDIQYDRMLTKETMIAANLGDNISVECNDHTFIMSHHYYGNCLVVYDKHSNVANHVTDELNKIVGKQQFNYHNITTYKSSVYIIGMVTDDYSLGIRSELILVFNFDYNQAKKIDVTKYCRPRCESILVYDETIIILDYRGNVVLFDLDGIFKSNHKGLGASRMSITNNELCVIWEKYIQVYKFIYAQIF